MKKRVSIPDEAIFNKIYEIRGEKVMLDRDLAELYGVETKRLKEQVRRNIERFPEDFMFELTKDELEDWRSQFATSNREVMGLRVAPFVFTEHGVLMLSSVLNSNEAIKVNIRIVRIYTRMKELLLTHKDLIAEMENIRRKVDGQDEKIEQIFSYLQQFVRKQETPRKQIGYRTDK
tara:strand:+ start:479 stop:1006 length:528 start_codon:yes stop_codon:yes gene_type:complete